MRATISVVVPVLDDARYLEACLTALDHQTRPPDEVVVVDNGSVDDSVAVARRHGARVVSERRRGVTAASACGFDAATGEIVARCDADSVVPATWLERIESDLARVPEAVAVTGPARFYELHGAPEILARTLYLGGYFVSMRLLLGHHVLFGSNCAVRAHAWQAVSASVPRDDPEVHDDMDLSYRLPVTAVVLHDRRLVVGISARPFVSLESMGRRASRAVRTFSLHLPAQLPHRRWAGRLRAGRRYHPTDSSRA